MTPYPHNPKNHKKNVEHWNNSTYEWFKVAFPSLTEADYHRYVDTENCLCCGIRWNKDVERCCYKGDAVCGVCNNILNNVIDLEHIVQVKDYLKGRNK